MTAAVQTLSSSAIGRSSSHSLPSHSQRSTAGGGALVSITVRRDDPKKKAGVKLEQDANGRVRVKNIAKNGMFGDSELEIGDTILSVNRERLGGKNGPEVLLKAARKHHTITVSVRKGAPGGKGASSVDDDDDNKPQKKDKKKWPSVKTTMTPTTKKKKATTKKQADGMSKRNADGSLTISAEKRKSSSSSSSSSVGLELEVRDEKLVVKGIEPKSIFAKTDLEVGDAVLSVNDMSFRRYPDAEYAARVMKKARVTVTLVVEKSGDTGDSGKGVGKKRSKRRSSSSSSSTDSSTDSSSDSEHEYEFEIETEFKIEKYRPVTIIAPKMFQGENAGLQFKLVKTVTALGKNKNKKTEKIKSSWSPKDDRVWVSVSKISDDSIFKDTALREGDKIISINDVDMRGEENRADKRVAYRECLKSTECVAMVVLKQDESVFLEKSFCLFDASTTNLDWMASATNLDWKG